METTETYAVIVERTELITFILDATSPQDAEERVLGDGNEVASRTKDLRIVLVEKDG